MAVHLGAKLQLLRKQKGLKQVEIAQLLGVSQASYSAWEKDKSYPTLEYLVKLSQVYETSIDYICGVSDSVGITNTGTRADILKAIISLCDLIDASLINSPDSLEFYAIGLPAVYPWLNEFIGNYKKYMALYKNQAIDKALVDAWVEKQIALSRGVPIQEDPFDQGG